MRYGSRTHGSRKRIGVATCAGVVLVLFASACGGSSGSSGSGGSGPINVGR